MSEKLVIVGNGMAPGRMLEHLFEAAPGRFDVTIFNAEPRVNYNRLMLSPVLSGEKTYEEIITHGEEWYAEHGVTLHKASPVTEIDRTARRVISGNGIVADYDHLVIATGSSPNCLAPKSTSCSVAAQAIGCPTDRICPSTDLLRYAIRTAAR